MAAGFQSMSHRVKFLVEIENFTNQPLHWVKLEMKSGGFQSPPANVIMAGDKKSFSGRKISYALAGASGAVAYRIGDSAKVIVISFSCPLFTGSNTLALKFYQWDQSQIDDMPKNGMYDQINVDGSWKKEFIQGERLTPLEVTDEGGDYKLGGGMGVCHTTIINVSLLPIDNNKIATKLKPGFGLKEPKEIQEVQKHEHEHVHKHVCKLL